MKEKITPEGWFTWYIHVEKCVTFLVVTFHSRHS